MGWLYAIAALWTLSAIFGTAATEAEVDPHDPELERATFQLLPGFEVNLFAAEPWVVKPIHMTWDPQGRLWICTSEAYPQVAPGEKPNDKIVVLEDTDGDGRADKQTVFADGLCVPTGLELADGGVYVANAPELLFFKDTDGDGRADVRQVVLSGFGTEDNHHSISAWRWGPDGWLYFQEGTFLHSQVETPYGVVRLENGGVFQFRPRQRLLRIFVDYRASNPWGHMIDRWGRSILIDNPQIYYLTPASANSRLRPPYDSMYRESTKLCGGDFVSGRHLPEQFQGELWSNAYKVHGIYRYRLDESGSGFSVTPLDPLLESTSESFRPVDLKMGPDGAVYVADWYNPLIGHMQYEFRDPRRDKNHGRIWRITYRGRPLVERPKLAGAPLAEVLKHLRDPEDWTRYQVRRELTNRDPDDVAVAVRAWVANLPSQDAERETLLLEANWCLQTVDRVDHALLRKLLSASDPHVRAAAVRALRYEHPNVSDALDLLATAVADDDPRVRLEAVLSLGFVPDDRAVTIACRALDRPMDRFLGHALKLTVDGLQPYWLVEFRNQRLKFDRPEHEQFAVGNVQSAEAIGPLLAMLNSGKVDRARLEMMLPVVATKASPRQLEPIWTRLTSVLAGGLDSDVQVQLLGALETASRRRKVKPPENLANVNRFLASEDEAVRVAAIGLAAAWNTPGLERRLTEMVRNEKLSPTVHYAAARGLAEVGRIPAEQLLEQLASEGTTLADRYTGVVGLAALDLSHAAPWAARVLAEDPGQLDPLPIVLQFVERREGGAVLATAFASQRPHAKVAARVLAWLNETGVHQPALADLLRATGPGAELEKQLSAEDPHQLAADALREGDAARGERIFRSHALACQKCHQIGNAGPELGPDLSSLGASSPPDYLVDSILRPSKGIKDQYQGAFVVTVDGRVLTGILAFQDERQLVLRDASRQGEPITIPASEIDEVAPSRQSLMPANLVVSLASRQEFLDLVKFLASLGRPGPYQVGKEPVLRTWRMRPCNANGQIDASSEPLPIYSRVDGSLPRDELVQVGGPLVQVEGAIDVLEGGRLSLRVVGASAVRSLAMDTRSLQLNGDHVLTQVGPGIRKLTLLVDPTALGDEGLAVWCSAAGDKPARFQVVAGR